MLLSGLFCLAIKQYHKKGILFHFSMSFYFGNTTQSHREAISFFLKGSIGSFAREKAQLSMFANC
jgi:hypothetical protein